MVSFINFTYIEQTNGVRSLVAFVLYFVYNAVLTYRKGYFMKQSEQNSIQERVSSICNDLYSKGTRPSIRLVLSMLPDVSSTSTVHKYFANWKKELEANQQSLYDRLGFSSEFTQSFMKEITRFGVEAEQRYKEQAVDSNDQRDIAIEELEKTEEKLHKQNAIIEQQQKEIKELQTEVIKVQDKLKADLSAEQQSNKVIVAELRQQLLEANNENKTLSSNNENLRTEIAKAELKLEGNQEYVNEVKTQNADLVKDNKELNKNIASLSKNIASYEATLSGNEKLITNLEASAKSNAENLTKINDEIAEYKNNVIDLGNELNRSNKINETLKEKLKEQLDNSNEKLLEANKTISNLNNTNKEQSSVITQLTALTGKEVK